MLEIVRYNEDSYEFPCLLVLGCFDGLHIGHADLLKKAKLQAKINGLDLGVMLFTDGKGGKYLYSFEERIKLLEKYNVKFVLKIDFDDEFKKIKPLDFLACLEEKLNVKAYMSGKDFRFGNGKKGKSSTLKSYAEDEENGVWYMSVKDVTCGDEKVSTTQNKDLIASGDMPRANELLGRNYSVSGAVTEENGSTVKVAYPEDKFEVKSGNYEIKCIVGEAEYAGVASCDNVNIEARLEGYDGGHVGETVTVEFLTCTDAAEAPEENEAPEVVKTAEAELAATTAEEPVEEVVEEVAEEPVVAEPVEEQPVEEQPVEEAPAEITEEAVETVEADDGLDDGFEDELEEPVEETATEEPVIEEQPAEEAAEVEEAQPEQPEEETQSEDEAQPEQTEQPETEND